MAPGWGIEDMGSTIKITDDDHKYSVELGRDEELDELSLEAFKLRNYKAFRDTGWISLNRMTIFYGANSAGKTALFYFLRFMWKCYNKREKGEIFFDTSRLRESEGCFDELVYSGAPDNRSQKHCFAKVVDNGSVSY